MNDRLHDRTPSWRTRLFYDGAFSVIRTRIEGGAVLVAWAIVAGLIAITGLASVVAPLTTTERAPTLQARTQAPP